MPSNKLEFKNQRGEVLVARLDLPADGEPLAYALFAHCFTCSKDLKAVHNISRALNQAEIAVLRFDFTGLGESEGNFAETNFSSNVEDLLDAARFLQERFAAPQLLIGHSLGGAAVLMAAQQLESVKAIATIGAPAEPQHVSHLIQNSQEDIESKGEADVLIGGRNFKVKKQFLDDLESTHMQAVVRSLKRALLILHSPIDKVVGIENASKLFETAKHPKSFLSLDNADHLVTRESDARYAGAMIAAWARKYLDFKEKPSWMNDVSDNRVAARLERGLRTEMLANGFALIADEPLAVGGTNTGPTPYDYLAAALGACTAMTLRMYADRKHWPLESVLVGIKHHKVHAADSQEGEKPKKLDHFERSLTLEGSLSEEQRQRLLDIANRCPVHRTLKNDVLIETQLKTEASP